MAEKLAHMDNQFINTANHTLDNNDLESILQWTFETFGSDVAMTSSFGYSGVVLIHHVLQFKPDIPIYFIDTGYHFPETIDFCERLKSLWNINLIIVQPAIDKDELVSKLGFPPYRKNPDKCCYYNKVKPLEKFIGTKTVWLSAIRRDQSTSRSNIRIVQKDRRQTLKVHPLYNWTGAQVWEYIKTNDLPYNPLHDRNYLSIGCQHCTIPIKEDMHERDGRWPFHTKTECGINLY